MHWVYLCVYYYICVSHVSAQETTTSFRAANRRHSGDFTVREANVEQAEMNKVTQGVNDVSLFALPAASRFHVLSAEHETSYQPTTYVLAVAWVLLITLNIIGVYYIFLWNRFAERHCRQHYAINNLHTPYHSHAKRKGNKSELLHQTAATPAASTEKPSRVSNRSMAVVGVNQGGRKGERRETNVSKLHAKHEQRATDDMGNNTQLVPLLESKYAVDPTTGGNSVVRKDSRTHAVEMQTIHETKDRPPTSRQRHEAWVDEAIIKHPRPNQVSEYVHHRMEETAVDEKLRTAKSMPQSVPGKENGRSGVEDQRQKSGASSAVEAEGSLLFLEEGSSASSLFND